MHPLPMDDRRARTLHRRSVPDRRFRSIGAYAPEAGKARAGSVPRRVAALLMPLALVSLLLAGCARTPPEDALRATIGSMQAAAEARDADALAEPLADDFAGPGGMDRDT